VDGRLAGVGDEFEGAADVPRGAVGSGDMTESGIVSSNYISIDLAASLPHTYAYVIGCGFANGCTTGGHDPVVPSGPDTVLKIYGAIVSVQDNTPPTLSLGGSGLLDGATQSATAPLTLSAAAPAGIAKLELYAGASPTPSVTQDFTQSPHCAFYEAVPCQNLSNYQYQVNTADLPNGTYYITVKAYDPAGNVVAVSSPSEVTVQNAINAGAGVANGVSPCAGEVLGVTVNGKAKAPVIPYGKAVTVRGLLHCGSVPIRDARVVITTSGGPSKAAINSAVLTGVDGSFSYKVPKGPDRTLRFSYTAYSNESKPSATATANIMVRPTIKLQITPHRTSNEHTIHWKGTLTAGPFPKAGVTLVVEVQEGKHWKVFDQVETNTKGQFHYNYHFHATEEPTTYTFRVALPNNGAQGYPYTPGSSNTIKIHVTT
jgi:hypothetical protein